MYTYCVKLMYNRNIWLAAFVQHFYLYRTILSILEYSQFRSNDLLTYLFFCLLRPILNFFLSCSLFWLFVLFKLSLSLLCLLSLKYDFSVLSFTLSFRNPYRLIPNFFLVYQKLHGSFLLLLQLCLFGLLLHRCFTLLFSFLLDPLRFLLLFLNPVILDFIIFLFLS